MPTLARPIQQDIADAGRSAFAWHDQALTDHLDPSRRLSRAGRALELVSATALSAGFVALAAPSGLPAAVVVGLIATIALAGTRGRTVLWIVPVAAIIATDPHLIRSAAGATLAVGVVAVMSIARRAALVPLTAVTVVWCVGVAAAAPDRSLATALAVAAVSVGVAVAVVRHADNAQVIAQKLLRRRTYGTAATWSWPELVRRRIRPADLAAIPARPQSEVPWLVRAVRMRSRYGQPYQPPEQIKRKSIGGYGEQKTAVALLAVRRHRAVLAHDVCVPLPMTTDANIDHLALTRAGAFVVDAKVFNGRITCAAGTVVQVSRNGTVRDLTKTLSTIGWEAEAVRLRLGVSVRAVMVIVGPDVDIDPGLVVYDADHDTRIDVVHVSQVSGVVDAQPATLSMPAYAQAVARMALLRPAVGDTVALRRSRGYVGDELPWSDLDPITELRGITADYRARRFTKLPTGAIEPLDSASTAPTATDTPRPPAAGDTPNPVEQRWMHAHTAAPALLSAGDWSTQITPGVVLEVYLGSDDAGRPDTATVRAVTAPVTGDDGALQVWACTDAAWSLHRRTGEPVDIRAYALPALRLAVLA